MAEFVHVPVERLPAETLTALLEEYASRDGTDYGQYEVTLEKKREELRAQLLAGDVQLVYDADSEHWDLLARDRARALLGEGR